MGHSSYGPVLIRFASLSIRHGSRNFLLLFTSYSQVLTARIFIASLHSRSQKIILMAMMDMENIV